MTNKHLFRRPIRSLHTYQVGPCNPLLIKDLRAEKLLYNCREDSTTIESSLQNKLFMQNKANFRKVKLNVNNVLTKDYDRMDTWSIRKTKPIQTQYKANSNPIKAKTNPIQTQNKPNACPPLRLAGLPVISVADQKPNLLIERPKSELLNFHTKNSLTVCKDSLKYWVLYCERDFL